MSYPELILHVLVLQGFGRCGFEQSPATALLTQLTLLSLRDNRLTKLATELPADSVQSLRVLDLSGNPLRWLPASLAAAENVAAFGSNWESLRVLGIRPREHCSPPLGLTAAARAVARLLRQQTAAAQPPRPPPIVVYSSRHEHLLQPADELATLV